MPIELSHIGEDLIAEMLRSLAHRRLLSRLTCAMSGRSLVDDIAEQVLGSSIEFHSDDATVTVNNAGVTYRCDGEQKVDVLVAGAGRGIAVEAKLGVTRMSPAEFRRRFCETCAQSSHANQRLSGSMVGVLERSLPFDGQSTLVASIGHQGWTLAEPWWLVVREPVLGQWRKVKDFPVHWARVLLFEDIARAFGSAADFDKMVARVVGDNFARRWQIPFEA
jgi:hypothetical protein